MKVSYRSPAAAWIEYAGGWYDVTARDGPLSDRSIAIALYHIAHFTQNGREDGWPEHSYLRGIWFDDSHGGIRLNFQVLQESGEKTPVDVAALESTYDGVPWHGQSVHVNVVVAEASMLSDHYHPFAPHVMELGIES